MVGGWNNCHSTPWPYNIHQRLGIQMQTVYEESQTNCQYATPTRPARRSVPYHVVGVRIVQKYTISGAYLKRRLTMFSVRHLNSPDNCDGAGGGNHINSNYINQCSSQELQDYQ